MRVSRDTQPNVCVGGEKRVCSACPGMQETPEMPFPVALKMGLDLSLPSPPLLPMSPFPAQVRRGLTNGCGGRRVCSTFWVGTVRNFLHQPTGAADLHW